MGGGRHCGDVSDRAGCRLPPYRADFRAAVENGVGCADRVRSAAAELFCGAPD